MEGLLCVEQTIPDNGPYMLCHCAGGPHKILIAFNRCFHPGPMRGNLGQASANSDLGSNGNIE